MNTGFFPQPNYILAATGGLGFAAVSYWIHMLEVWYLTIMMFSILSMTSIWFHIWRTDFAYHVDNSAALFTGFLSMYECYRRGPMVLGIGLLPLLYGSLVFYCGYLGKCYAFDPNPIISTFFHASLHVLLGVSLVVITMVFPVPEKADSYRLYLV